MMVLGSGALPLNMPALLLPALFAFAPVRGYSHGSVTPTHESIPLAPVSGGVGPRGYSHGSVTPGRESIPLVGRGVSTDRLPRGDLCTTDGLRLEFDGPDLVGASVDGRALRNSSTTGNAAPGGFRVRSYTSPSPPNAELLSNQDFIIPGPTDALARDWVGVGGGYRRQLDEDGTAAIILHNKRTNVSAGAAQDVVLSQELWGGRSSASGPVVLRLSGWAAAEGLRSDGTCADEGSCRLHDAFSVSATLTFATAKGVNRSILLSAASFQSGSHASEYSFAVLELPPAPAAALRDSGSNASGGSNVQSGSVGASLRVVLTLRGYAGTVKFTNVSLVRMPWTNFIANIDGGNSLTRPNASALRVNAVTQPTSIEDTVASVPPLSLDATVSARARHIRIDGKVTLLDAPAAALQSAARDDHALTIQFGIPVDINEKTECWKLGMDANSDVGLPYERCHAGNEAIDEYRSTASVLHGRRQRGYYDGAGEEGTVEGEVMVPPLPSDWYPLLPLWIEQPETSVAVKHVEEVGIAIALPMEPTVYASRAEFSFASNSGTTSGMLSLSFDLALTPRARGPYHRSTSFSLVLYKLDAPKWGFRTALDKYYALHPAVYGPSRTVRKQGNWLPFQSTVDVQNHSDFGFAFQEGGSGGTAAQTMNSEGCGIFPYIEPHVIHWPINGSGPCHTGEAWSNWTANTSGCVNWSELNRSVMDCISQPAAHNTSATSGPLPILCNEIVSSALYGPSRERWFFRPENVPWNQGAMLYPALNTALLRDPRSRVAQITTQIENFYASAADGNYSLSGIYIDSTQGFGAPFLLNYKPAALAYTKQPPVFSASGGAAVLNAQDYLDFLTNLSVSLREKYDHRLFGNAMYMLPQIQFATAFDIAGIETGWDAATKTPATPQDMAFVRAMSAAKPYLYLMDTSFAHWTIDDTAAYHDVCLLRGIWPGFFSANAFGNLYWSQPALYNRDRPVFKHYVPLLQRINYAGWRPVPHARVHGGIYGTISQAATVERWGGPSASSPAQTNTSDAGPDSHSHLLWTVRYETLRTKQNLAASRNGAPWLEIEAAALEIVDGEHKCEVLSNGWGLPSKPGQLLLDVHHGTGRIAKLPLRANTTLLIVC